MNTTAASHAKAHAIEKAQEGNHDDALRHKKKARSGDQGRAKGNINCGEYTSQQLSTQP